MGNHNRWRRSRRELLGSSLAGLAAATAAPLGGRAVATRATNAEATPAATTDPDALFAELDAFVSRRIGELGVPGAAIGIIFGDREHAAGFGVTSVEHPLPVDADTLFQIGSTTKTVTGTTVMRLVEQGTLDLEAPVRTYLPEFRVADPDVSTRVRLRHLVTHTVGWYDAGEVETGDGDDALARLVAGMADRPQIAPLGQYLSYNNEAVDLAGRVIEVVTGQTYEAAATELVLEPLGMERASFFPEEVMTEGFAVGHAAPPDDPEGAPVVVRPWGLPRASNPAGGLAVSVAEQLRHARFHLGDGTANGQRVLSADNLRRMQEPLGPGGTLPSLVSPIDAVGVTWLLRRRDGARVVSHSGGTFGQMSSFDLVPGRAFALTVLTNALAGLRLLDEVADLAFERFLGLRPTRPATVNPDPARLAEYVGEYAMPNGAQSIRVRRDGGSLGIKVHAPGQPPIASPLRFVGDDLVTADYLWLTVLADFVRDDAGNIGWFRFLGRLVPKAA